MIKSLTGVVAILFMVVAQGALAERTIKTEDFSGWMQNYETLTYDEKRNAFIFENEDKRGLYQRVLLGTVAVYSRTAEADETIAGQATAYMDEGIRDLLDRKGIRAKEPGPGVIEMKVAITGVQKSKEQLKAYNFIPVGAVFRGAQEVSGKVASYIDTRFEGEMVDSVTGDRVVAIVSKGIEETSKRSGDSLQFEDIIPTLDKWLAQLEENLDRNLARRAETVDPAQQ